MNENSSDEDEAPENDLALGCLCNNCPDDPSEFSSCCLYEAKIKVACVKEGVSCITKVAKMTKVWDKV